MSIIELAALVWLIGKMIGVGLFLLLAAMILPCVFRHWWTERKAKSAKGGAE